MIPEKKRPKFVDRFENFTEENEKRSRFNIGKEDSVLDYSSLMDVNNYIDAFRNDDSSTQQQNPDVRSEFVSSAYSLDGSQNPPVLPTDLTSKINGNESGNDVFVSNNGFISHTENGMVDNSLFIDDEEVDFSVPDVESAFVNEDGFNEPVINNRIIEDRIQNEGLADQVGLSGLDTVNDKYKTTTEYGGGAAFDNHVDKNGKIVTDKVALSKFKERSDKKSFKSKAENVFDKASRAADLVKPEENEAAASNVDEKAIVATLIAKGVIDDNVRRYKKIHKGLKKDIKQLEKESRAAQFEDRQNLFNNSQTEFVDKLSVFTDKYEGIFRDPISDFKGDDYFGASSFSAATALAPNVAAIQKSVENNKKKQNSEKQIRIEDKFSEMESFERTEEINRGTRYINSNTGTGVDGKFEESTISENENKNKRSVDSYFSGDDRNEKNEITETRDTGVKSSSDSSSSGGNRKEKEQKKSEDKKVKQAEKQAKKKAAAIASVTAMLKVKKEMQNSLGDMSGNSSDDLMKEGSKGIISGVIGVVKEVVLSKVRLVVLQALASLLGLIVQGIVIIVPIIVVVVIFSVVLTGQLGVFTDSITNPFLGVNMPSPGDGNVYHSLSEADVDAIIEDLYLNYPGNMNSTQEAMLRYALSKVGCAYNQDYHGSLTVDIFDCSSLAYRAFRAVGIDISNRSIYTAAEECRFASENGHAITGGDLIPGDLIFYGGSANRRFLGTYHVGIYVGNGKMVEARGKSSGVVYCDVRTSNAVLYARYAA